MEIKEYISFDDRALTQMVVEGDSRAFDTLFTRHRDKIYALLVKRSNNSDDVEDLLQETFMKAFVNINRYNPRYDFGAWICTIAKNSFVDFNRSRQTKALDPKQNLPLDGHFSTSQSSIPTPETPEESIIHAQQRAQIDRYISLLPENYRLLFQLRFLDEYSYEEIAEKLNMKLGTVKTQIFRIRAMMCRMVTEGESHL